MATIDKAIDKLGALLGYPDWETLSLANRLMFVTHAIDDLIGELNLQRVPQLVNYIDVDALTGGTAQTLPSDFGTVYSVYTNSASYPNEPVYEIPVTLPPDREFAANLPQFRTGLASVEITNVGSARRISAYPIDSQATDITVAYRPANSGSVGTTSEIPLHEAFHNNLVPVEAAWLACKYCTWATKGMSAEAAPARRDELYQHLSVLRMEQRRQFKLLSNTIDADGPSSLIVGFGALRNQRRFGGR